MIQDVITIIAVDNDWENNGGYLTLCFDAPTHLEECFCRISGGKSCGSLCIRGKKTESDLETSYSTEHLYDFLGQDESCNCLYNHKVKWAQ